MKRSLTELFERYKEAENEYIQEASFVIERFFREGRDIFRSHILLFLSHDLNIKSLKSLRLVSKNWLSCVTQVEHVNIIFDRVPNYSGNYHVVLKHLFVCALSVKSHQEILDNSYCNTEQFGRLTRLEILDRQRYENYDFTSNIGLFTSLKTLVFPRFNESKIEGISRLIALTDLTCTGEMFESQQDLLLLTNLKELKITDLKWNIDLSLLKNLTYLESDRLSHFSSFTGEGMYYDYNEDGEYLSDHEEEEIQSLYDKYKSGFRNLRLNGKWECGNLVKGHGFMQWYDEETGGWLTRKGSMENDKFHGKGVEEDDHHGKWVCIGEWRNGMKHGIEKWFRWERWRGDNDEYLIPVSEELWEYDKFVHAL